MEIGPTGGVLTTANGRLALEFPPGAVSGTTAIEHTPSLGGPRGTFFYRFSLRASDTATGEAVTGFSRPLTVTVSYAPEDVTGLDETSLRLFYLDETVGHWVRAASRLDRENRRIVGVLEHFSDWAAGNGDGSADVLPSVRGIQTDLATGAATLSYPLALPSGPGGLAPSLALAYSSGSVDDGRIGITDFPLYFLNQGSWAGLGWDLAGLGSIATSDSRYFLTFPGGSVEISRTTSGEWQTQPQQFLKVTHDSSIGCWVAENVGQWFVWSQDGTKYTFGSPFGSCDPYQAPFSGKGTAYSLHNDGSDTSLSPYRWFLTKVEDVHGNTIDVFYDQDTRQLNSCFNGEWYNTYVRATYPVSITYGNGVSVLLNRSSRSDTELKIMENPGCTQVHFGDYKLDNVEVKVGGELARRYALGYDYQNPNNPTATPLMLRAITETSPSGATLPPYQFTYDYTLGPSGEMTGVYQMLVLASNGYGGQVGFDYTRILVPFCDTGGCSAAWSESARSVVSSRMVSDGLGSGWRWDYSYSGAAARIDNYQWYDLRGYDYLGMTLTQETVHSLGAGAAGDVVNAYWYYQWLPGGYTKDPRHGKAFRLLTGDGGGTTIISSTSAYSYTTGTDGIHAVRLDQSDTYRGDKQSRAAYTYDAYGNVVRSHEFGDVSISTDDRFITNTYVYSTTPWIVNTLSRQQTFGADGTTELARTDTYYDRNTDGTLRSWGSAPIKGELAATRQVHLGGSGDSLTEHRYDTYGNRTVITDALGNATATAYDAVYHTYPLTVTNALGQSVYSGYSYTLGKVLTETDANNAQTLYAYDAFGRIKKVARPGDSLAYPTEQYDYFDGGDQARTTSWPFLIGHWQRGTAGLGWTSGGMATASRAFYDGLGHLVQRQQMADGCDIVQYTGYDGPGRAITQSVPYTVPAYSYSTLNGLVVTPYKTPDTTKPATLTRYDALGRTTVITAADGTATRSTYQGWTTAVVDANSHQRISASDAFGRLAQVKEFDGSFAGGANFSATAYATTTYAYDALGSLTRVTDTLGYTTSIQYDPLGRKTAMTDPDMGNWRYRYDGGGNLVVQIDARRQATSLYYDALGRLVGKRYDAGPVNPDTYQRPSDTGAYSVTYAFDQGAYGIGRRTAMTDTSGSTAWAYDARGRVLTESHVIAGAGTYALAYGYDAADRPITTTYPTGEVITRSYNTAGLPAGLRSQTNSVWYATGVTYNALGLPTRVQYGNGAESRLTYYGLDTPQWGALFFGRPRQNCVIAQSDPNCPYNGDSNALLNLSYWYDAVGNVTSIRDRTNANQVQWFGYDALDRLTQGYTSATGSGTYSHTNAYSAIGNLTVISGTTQWYSDTAHVHAVTHLGGTRAFWYDANGNAITRTVAGVTQVLAWDGENRLLSVTQGGTTYSYTYDGDGNRVKVTAGGVVTAYVGNLYEANPTSGVTTTYYYLNGERVAMRTSSGVTWLAGDHLGSTSLATNAAGAKVSEERYLPYGGTRSGSMPTDYQFTGQKNDVATGLYYYNARYYDPSVGRFISADTFVPSAGNPQALNRYAYVYNNPLRFVDPSGFCALVEEDAEGLCVRTTSDGGMRVVHGGSTFVNPVEVALANAYLSGDVGYLDQIPADVPFAMLGRSNANVLSGLGYRSSQSILDAVMQQGPGVVAATLVGAFKPVSGSGGSFEWAASVPSRYKPGVVASFKGEPRAQVLTKDLVVYRYWGGASSETGAPYFATRLYSSPARARRYLALPTYNTAERVSGFRIPAGTTVIRGSVAPQVGSSGYGSYASGGGEQIYVADTLAPIRIGPIEVIP